MAKHDPNDTCIVMDIVGTCQKCMHHANARMVVYWSGEILIRCGYCKRASTYIPYSEENDFIPDNTNDTDPKRFEPFLTDEDDEKPRY